MTAGEHHGDQIVAAPSPQLPRRAFLASAALSAAGLALGACSGGRPRRTAPSAFDSVARPASVIIDQQPWSFDGVVGRRIETPSFVLFTTLDDALLLGRLPLFLELGLTHYRTELGELPAPDRKLETYALRTRHQWTLLVRSLLPDEAETYLRISRGGFAADARGVYFDIGPRDTLAVAAHEGWHQYVQAVFEDPLPVWLDEGVASWMEGFRWDPTDPRRPIFSPWANIERHDALRIAVTSSGVLGLEELLDARPQDLINSSNAETLRYYAQVWALTHFLAEGSAGVLRPALRSMLADAAAGRLYDRVRGALGSRAARNARVRRVGAEVLAAYAPEYPLDTLDAAYRGFIARAVMPGARERIAAGVSPVA